MTLSLALLRDHIHPGVVAFTTHTVKASASPAEVHRVELAYRDGVEGGPASVMLKRINPDWPGDAGGGQRETRFYRTLAPRLCLAHPRLYYAGAAPEGDAQIILMATVNDTHRFPPPTHLWNEWEARALLRAYARLHASAAAALPPEAERGWLYPPYWERVQARAGELEGMVETLVARGVWDALPAFPRLVERTLRQIEEFSEAPATLLHNDVTPPNAALPRDMERGEVLIIDWEMVGWGPPEFDLAFMFHQPFDNHRALDREASLAWYWQEVARAGGRVPAGRERLARQQYADRVLSLWLVPVAHAFVTGPPASAWVSTYWNSMLGVLGRSLSELCRALA